MNVLWGSAMRIHGSVWTDGLVWPVNPRWSGVSWFHAVGHRPTATIDGRTAYGYDEIDPDQYQHQTPEGFRTLAERTRERSLIAIGHTFTPAMQACVEAIAEANNPLVRIAQEFYVFGEDGSDGDVGAQTALDWYVDRVLTHLLVPIYNVSNRADLDNGHRAFSHDPGLVTYWWYQLMRRFKLMGVYDAAVWGADYLAQDERMDAPGRAIRAWDHCLATVFYG